MSIANEHADNFYFPHFEFKDSVNATYIMEFWDQTPCSLLFGRIEDNTIYFWNFLTFSAIPEMISTHCVEKLTHCKAVSSPLNDSLSISHLTSEKNCISLIDSLVFGHLNIVLCLEGRPILLVVFRLHEFWKRRGEICKTREKPLFLLTCSWHQKKRNLEFTNSRILKCCKMSFKAF